MLHLEYHSSPQFSHLVPEDTRQLLTNYRTASLTNPLSVKILYKSVCSQRGLLSAVWVVSVVSERGRSPERGM